MRTISRHADIPVNTRYYSQMYDFKGNDGYTNWTRLYDRDLNVIEDVQIRMIDMRHTPYKRVCSEDQKRNEIALTAYQMRDMGNGFFEVTERGDTLQALELIAQTMRR